MNSLSISANNHGPAHRLEVWDRYFNGPNPGMIDVALAKRDAPWLIGSGDGISIISNSAGISVCHQSGTVGQGTVK